MAIRTTQVVIETLVQPNPKVRTTQVVLEALVAPPSPAARITQLAIEVLVRPVSGNPCEASWAIPAPNPYPVPANGGPMYNFFQESEPDWGEFGRSFRDGVPRHNTLQTTGIRRFVFEYRDLSEAEAALLDAHFESTRGGLSFRLTRPRTNEVINGVRYEDYTRSPHTKKWLQNRSVKLVKYTN